MLWFGFMGLVSISLLVVLLYRLFKAKPPRDFKIEAGLPLDSILPYRNEQGLWGFRHRNGQILTEAKYQGTWLQAEISPVFWVLNDGLWFALDAQGQVQNEQGYPIILMYPAEKGRPAYLLGFDEGVHLLKPQGQSYFQRFLGRGYNDIKVFETHLLSSKDYSRGRKGASRSDVWYQIYNPEGQLLDSKEYTEVLNIDSQSDSLCLLVASKRKGQLSLWKQGQKPSPTLISSENLGSAHQWGIYWLLRQKAPQALLLYNDQGNLLHQSQNSQEKIHLHRDFALVQQGQKWLYFGPNQVQLSYLEKSRDIRGISLNQGLDFYLIQEPSSVFLSENGLSRKLFEQIQELLPKQGLAILEHQGQKQLYDVKAQRFLIEQAQDIQAIKNQRESFLMSECQNRKLEGGFLVKKQEVWYYFNPSNGNWTRLNQIKNLGLVQGVSNLFDDYVLFKTEGEHWLYRLSDGFELRIQDPRPPRILNPKQGIISREEAGRQDLVQIQGLNLKTLGPLPKLGGTIEFVWPSGLILLLNTEENRHSLHNLAGQNLVDLGLTSIFARNLDPVRGLVVPYGEQTGVYNHEGQKIAFEAELFSPHLCFGNLICEGQANELREAYLGREIFDWSGRRWPN